MKKWISALIAAMFIVCGPITAFAQNESQAQVSEETVAPDNNSSQEVTSSSGEQEGLVTFDFKDADIRNVLRIFSHKTGINIVASPEVQGSVTVKLNNVPWEKALKIILEMNNFAYVREENVIKVLTRDRIAQEPLKTEVIALDYARATTVVTTVQSMLTERGQVRTDERANLLIISDVPSAFDPIKQVIKRLDLPTPQVLIETKLIETTLDLKKKFGVKWNFLDEYSVGYNGDGENGALEKAYTKTSGDRTTNTYTTSYAHTGRYDPDNPRYTRQLAEDAEPDEETGAYSSEDYETFYKLKHSELNSFEVPDWSTSTAGYTKAVTQTVSDGVTSTFNTFLSASKMQVVMSALMSDGGTDILSTPSIVTMDNKEASIKVASDYPMPSFTYNDNTGVYEISGFTPTPIGITLTVTPHVAPNGYVTMDLAPEISKEEKSVTFAKLGADIPQIGKENVKTSIMVKDGDTVVLGGLMRQFDTYNNQKVPILHSIPVLGWLFKYKDKRIEKRNLLIFVTPNILKKENVGTITQNRTDEYTKIRDSFEETTTVYPTQK